MVWAEAVRGGEERVGPVIVEMCIMLSRGAFCTRDVHFALENDGWNCTLECKVHVSAKRRGDLTREHVT